jgi:aspartate/methionine/tyrosine aminotransferase
MAYPLFLLKWMIRSGLARFLPGINRLTEGGGDYLRYYADPILTAPRTLLQDTALLSEMPPADVIDLSGAQPRFEVCTPAVPRASADRRGSPPPWGLPELCGTVAERLLAERQMAFSPVEEILITQGAAGALQIVLDSLVNRGDRVVLFDPTSPLFPLALRGRGVKLRWLYSWNEEGRQRFKLHELDRALRGARMLILCTPGNPSGGYVAPEDLEQLAWWAEKHNVLLVNDETFAAFRYEGDGPGLGALSRARQRTLTIGSVSKSHGLPALRVGWLAGNRHLLRACRVGAALRLTTVPTICQQMALAALRQSGDVLTAAVSDLAGRRRYALERLQGVGLNAAWPAGGLYLWVPVWRDGLSGRDFAQQLLTRKRVQVTPGDLFGPSGAGYVRVSFAGDEGRLREGLGRLAEFIRPTATASRLEARAA